MPMSTFKIGVKVLGGSYTDLLVKSSHTIQMVKVEIERIWKVPPDKQILEYENVVLEDEHTLDYYMVEKNCRRNIFLKGKDENDLPPKISQRTMIPCDIHLRILDGNRKVVEFIGVWRGDRLRDTFERLIFPFDVKKMGLPKDCRFSVYKYKPDVPLRSMKFIAVTTQFRDVFDASDKVGILYVYKQNRVSDPVLADHKHETDSESEMDISSE